MSISLMLQFKFYIFLLYTCNDAASLRWNRPPVSANRCIAPHKHVKFKDPSRIAVRAGGPYICLYTGCPRTGGKVFNDRFFFSDSMKLDKPVKIAIAEESKYIDAIGIGNINVYNYTGSFNKDARSLNINKTSCV